MKLGEEIIVTERGKPVARIVPVATALAERMEALEQAGLVAWNGRRLPALKPGVRVRGRRTVAELLLEDRE